jgi:hypothetical protein
VGYGDNLDGASLCAVDDQLVADRPEENREPGEILPPAPHTRNSSKLLEPLEELLRFRQWGEGARLAGGRSGETRGIRRWSGGVLRRVAAVS